MVTFTDSVCLLQGRLEECGPVTLAATMVTVMGCLLPGSLEESLSLTIVMVTVTVTACLLQATLKTVEPDGSCYHLSEAVGGKAETTP